MSDAEPRGDAVAAPSAPWFYPVDVDAEPLSPLDRRLVALRLRLRLTAARLAFRFYGLGRWRLWVVERRLRGKVAAARIRGRLAFRPRRPWPIAWAGSRPARAGPRP
jgi:hypothetical protein